MMSRDSWEEQFDELWSSAVKQNYEAEVPDPGPSWGRVSMRLAREGAALRRRKRTRMVAAAAAVLLLGAFLFETPAKTSAFQPVTKFMESVRGDVLNLIYGEEDGDRRGAKTNPPAEGQPSGGASGSFGIPEEAPTASVMYRTIEEAEPKMPYGMRKPGYIPEGWTLKEIAADFRGKQQIDHLAVTYSDESGKALILTQSVLAGTRKESFKLPMNAASKNVRIAGREGRFAADGRGDSLLVWVGEGVEFVISAPLPEGELVRIAETLK